jgi:hypothetical protein
MQYYIQKTLSLPFEKALDRVRQALGGEGFGVLAEIDVEQQLHSPVNSAIVEPEIECSHGKADYHKDRRYDALSEGSSRRFRRLDSGGHGDWGGTGGRG